MFISQLSCLRYNEADGRLRSCAEALLGGMHRCYTYELVLVNDGSKDETWAKMVATTEQDPHVVGVNLARNHGHQLALTAGLSLCRGQRILIIDADLQDPPELLHEMMGADGSGADVVYGCCRRAKARTVFKRATACRWRFTAGKLIDNISADRRPSLNGAGLPDVDLDVDSIVDLDSRLVDHSACRCQPDQAGARRRRLYRAGLPVIDVAIRSPSSRRPGRHRRQPSLRRSTVHLPDECEYGGSFRSDGHRRRQRQQQRRASASRKQCSLRVVKVILPQVARPE